MKHEQIENLFFSRNHDFLYIYIPKQQNTMSQIVLVLIVSFQEYLS